MDKVKKLANSFIEKHWDEIDKKKCDIKESKTEVLKMIANDICFATWIITECMWWGCDVNYAKEYIFECESDFHIYKIDDSYFKYDRETDILIEVTPKHKMVMYFD